MSFDALDEEVDHLEVLVHRSADQGDARQVVRHFKILSYIILSKPDSSMAFLPDLLRSRTVISLLSGRAILKMALMATLFERCLLQSLA